MKKPEISVPALLDVAPVDEMSLADKLMKKLGLDGRYSGLLVCSQRRHAITVNAGRFLRTNKGFLYVNLEELAAVEKLLIDSFPVNDQETPSTVKRNPAIKQTPASEGFMINQYHELSKLLSEVETDTTISKAHSATAKERVEALSNQSKRKKKPSGLLSSLMGIRK